MICTTPVPPAHHDGGTASAISHYEWLAFDGDGSGYVPDFESMGFPSFLRGSSGPEDAGDTQDVFFDARPDPEDLQLNIPATEGRGGILSTNPVELESGLTASISSSELTVSSDSFWSPGSGSSALTSPSTAWESPYLSPDLLLGQSPLQGFPFSSSTSTSAEGVSQASGGPDSAIPSASWGTPCQFPDLFPGPSSLQGFTLGSPEDMSPYVASSWNRYEGGLGAPAAFPGQAGAQEPPLQVTTTKQSSALQDRPAGLSARQWRYQTKPEKCPICGKGHSYRGELKKHIVAHHPEVAAELGVSTERPVCEWCKRSFAREDHLTRHLNLRHGRPKGRRKRGQ